MHVTQVCDFTFPLVLSMASVAITQGPSQPTSSSVNPSSVTDDYWVWVKAPRAITSSQKTLGKWLVFKENHKLDETWHTIRKVVESGELGARSAKCSTAMKEPPYEGSTMGVICVYTSEETMDEVGQRLVHIVKQDIRYKTDEATLKGLYAWKGYKVSLKTIYWNDGEPSSVRKTVEKRHGRAKHDSKGICITVCGRLKGADCSLYCIT